MKRSALLLALLSIFLLPAPGGATVRALDAPPPPGAISSNVEFIANVSPGGGAISINFVGNTMLVSTSRGLFSYSISDPSAPELLGALPMYIWENEDMDVDVARQRVFISRDPRGFTSSATSGATFPYGAVHIIDVSNPHALTQVGFFLVPAGHTSTCVNRCDYIWTGGPYANAQTNPGFTGRPIYATDVRDPANPVSCPTPIDTGRNDGVTDYAHDVQVDANGVAWVSGAGGVRGYWTEGQHLNPLTGQVETATGCSPIPYGGGMTPEEATPSRFMHNAWRNVNATIPGEDDPATSEDETRGMVLYATEENITSNCGSSGRFATFDLRGTLDGEGWKADTAGKFARMRTLDTWTPQGEEGATACASAHYLSDRGDGILAYAFYGQGTRFLDVSDPKDIRQIGYFRPNGASTWAPYWHEVGGQQYVFIADNARGVDIVRLNAPGSGTASFETVVAPPLLSAISTLTPSTLYGYLCPQPAA